MEDLAMPADAEGVGSWTLPDEDTFEEVVPQDDPPERWMLTLYVKRGSLRSSQAILAIRRICERDLAGRVDLQVVDMERHPEALEEDQVLAIPTLIKRLPLPLRRIVGDLSREDVVRAALDIFPAEERFRGLDVRSARDDPDPL
ncbi:MAG: circadian clock KaiB family protein [Prochlorococcaceae cyanobacterium]|jgi:circadian clock protein KaiB